MKQIRRRLTFANVVACLALFVALGGASYAAIKLPKNSVGTKQIKKNAVNTAKIKKNAVTTAKIKNAAVTTAKLKNGAVTGAKVNIGSLGTVPSATSASNVNGVSLQRFFAQDASNTPPHTIATVGSLTIRASCDAGGKPVLEATLAETSNSMRNVYGNPTFGDAALPAGTYASLTNGLVPFGGLGTADFIGYNSHTDYKIEWFVRDSGGSPLGNGSMCFYSGYVSST